jgi:hypothetical protein
MRNELATKVKAVDARRGLLKAAIVSFGEQLNSHLGIVGQNVLVGTQKIGEFVPGEFFIARNGGIDFDVQLKFKTMEGFIFYPTAKLNIQFSIAQDAYEITSDHTGAMVTVPYVERMEGAFTSAFGLVQPGIEAAFSEFYKQY